jgi:hypothetical protein
MLTRCTHVIMFFVLLHYFMKCVKSYIDMFPKLLDVCQASFNEHWIIWYGCTALRIIVKFHLVFLLWSVIFMHIFFKVHQMPNSIKNTHMLYLRIVLYSKRHTLITIVKKTHFSVMGKFMYCKCVILFIICKVYITVRYCKWLPMPVSCYWET